MKSLKKTDGLNQVEKQALTSHHNALASAIKNSWRLIAPSWPLKNLVAVNPAVGFEDLPFKEALKQSHIYFQNRNLPKAMHCVNRETIKWLQAFFDKGQAIIEMPFREQGLLKSFLTLIPFDRRLTLRKRQWLEKLPMKSSSIIAACLLNLGIPSQSYELFLMLMLTTLPGWASYIQYHVRWSNEKDRNHAFYATETDYLALRLILMCLFWSSGKELLSWHHEIAHQIDTRKIYNKINELEYEHREILIKKLQSVSDHEEKKQTSAQFVFCIDVRSEAIRRFLELQGGYETFGAAGFFNLPIDIENTITKDSYACCPVLVKPHHTIKSCPNKKNNWWIHTYLAIKKTYHSLKNNLTTSFTSVEMMGIAHALLMVLRIHNTKLLRIFRKNKWQTMISTDLDGSLEHIPVNKRVEYAVSLLKTMGLTKNFAPFVILCGHGATTSNNPHHTALNCGACGGHHGDLNARVMANILNTTKVRQALLEYEIEIPSSTFFIAAKHDTTTDEIKVYDQQVPESIQRKMTSIKEDLETVTTKNNLRRAHKMDLKSTQRATRAIQSRAEDWSQTRPEWGLAGHTAFIIGPRWLTKTIDLDGRAFLHSYDWQQDQHKASLEAILTAPLLIAQWINTQYLFATMDNITFGSGSKITQNITGKMGVMQGNASDLMNGLTLQSVYKNDKQAYHQLIRLQVVVYAPKSYPTTIINQHARLKDLFRNNWMHLICLDPNDGCSYKLEGNLKWAKVN